MPRTTVCLTAPPIIRNILPYAGNMRITSFGIYGREFEEIVEKDIDCNRGSETSSLREISNAVRRPSLPLQEMIDTVITRDKYK